MDFFQKKQIKLQERNVEYTLKLSKCARRMSLAVYHGGDFVVTAPTRMSQNTVEQFITQKSRWVVNTIEHLKQFPVRTARGADKVAYAKHKEVALKLAEERVRHFNALYGFAFNKIQIRNQKTRWGSCSKKGNLTFNYKIALLPQRLADYIVVHELCHLGQFNHSEKFWNLVARAIPDHLAIRKELKQKGIYSV